MKTRRIKITVEGLNDDDMTVSARSVITSVIGAELLKFGLRPTYNGPHKATFLKLVPDEGSLKLELGRLLSDNHWRTKEEQQLVVEIEEKQLDTPHDAFEIK